MFIKEIICFLALAAASLNALAVPASKAERAAIYKRNQYDPKKAASKRTFLQPIAQRPAVSSIGCSLVADSICLGLLQECVNGKCQPCTTGTFFNVLTHKCEGNQQLPTCSATQCASQGGQCVNGQCTCPSTHLFNTYNTCVQRCGSVNPAIGIIQKVTGGCEVQQDYSCSSTGFSCASDTSCRSRTIGGSFFCLKNDLLGYAFGSKIPVYGH